MKKISTGVMSILILSASAQKLAGQEKVSTHNSDKANVLSDIAKMNDPVIEISSSPEKQKLGDYFGAKSKAELSYEWGYALVRMESVMRDYINVPNPKPATSYRAPLNQIGWATRLPTAEDKDMPTANNDTYYMSAVVDLTEPYILSVPNTHDRYYVVNVFDMYQNLTAYIGRRATGTEAGNFAIVPPGWEGQLPSNIKKVIKVKTPKIWLWGRLRVKQGEDNAPLLALQNEFKLKTLSEFNGGTSSNKSTSLPAMPTYSKTDSLGFYKKLAWAMSQNPIGEEDNALVGQFGLIGIQKGKFDAGKLNTQQKNALYDASLEAPLSIVASINNGAVLINGWNFVTKMSDFGYDYALRSMISGPYLGGNGAEEALYPIRYVDANGESFDGKNTYTMTFPEEPPVNAFWSLTMYDANNKLLVENKLNRYKLSPDMKGFEKDKDGSFTITMSNKAPKNTNNWLPAPDGPFYIILRLYQPQDVVLQGKYDIPNVYKK